MQLIRRRDALEAALGALRQSSATVALVPTMGALHDGHMALVAEARRRADRIVASIFVNPRQFGANEDLATYPRREPADAAILAAAGCDLLWAPAPEEMYPFGFATTVSVAGLGDELDGAARPGHFDGVATVVAKLLAQVRPDVALFGEKDWQQLMIVRRMAADLDLGVAIVGVPTVRDDHGLALSSRNAYLAEDELRIARTFPRALGEAAAALGGGADVAATLAAAHERLRAEGFDVDYVALRDTATFAPVDRLVAPARLLAAARIGRTRLIDNFAVDPG